ncbi:MAG: radical SAM protein [Candidatus Buchananbacteria bacterium]|nr:radical SAM protein [Candidatus Buchananbacteria bacterium]
MPAISYKKGFLVYSPDKGEITYLDRGNFKKNLLTKNRSAVIKDKKVDYDLRVFFTITENCNLNCKYCFGNYGKNKGKMSPILAKKILISMLKKVRKNNRNKKVQILFSGGEPTLNMELIVSIVDFLKSKQISSDFSISTNGIMPEHKLEYLIKNNFFIRLSCDGIPRIQNLQRPTVAGGPSADILEKNIRKIVKANSRHLVKVVITPQSLNYMCDAVKYLSNLGIRNIRLDHIRNHGRSLSNYRKMVNQNMFIENFISIMKHVDDNGLDVILSNSSIGRFFNPAKSFCQFMGNKNFLAVNWNGKISKCIEHPDDLRSSFSIGRFKDNQLNINYDKKKRLESLSVDMMDSCKDCFAKYICCGGCFNRNKKSTGNCLTPDKYDCEFKKKMIKRIIIYFYENGLKVK